MPEIIPYPNYGGTFLFLFFKQNKNLFCTISFRVFMVYITSRLREVDLHTNLFVFAQLLGLYCVPSDVFAEGFQIFSSL